MNVHLDYLGNCISGPRPSTTVRSILDDARKAGSPPPCYLPEQKVSVRLPGETMEWLHQQAQARGCAMAEIIRAYVANQAASELTALYQEHTASPAEFSAALWSVLGYEPEFPPGEEVRGSV